MIAHGSAYVTVDVDFAYSRDRPNISSVVQALETLHPTLRGFPPGLPFAWNEQTVRSAANLTLVTDACDVDLLGVVAGVSSFVDLWNRSVEKELYGVRIRVASIDDLISMKRAANRPKDQNHVMELLALKKLIEEERTGEL